MCCADSLEGLVPVLPFNILEPKVTYSDGEPRHDGASLSYTAACPVLLRHELRSNSLQHIPPCMSCVKSSDLHLLPVLLPGCCVHEFPSCMMIAWQKMDNCHQFDSTYMSSDTIQALQLSP